MNKVLLGYTVPEGEPFYIPRAHGVITGMSNLSGKSTTAEAIVQRSKGIKALVFLTKRGEKTFYSGSRIRPYYRERFDWEYVRGLLEASMKERLKFETPWIIKLCKRAQVELKRKYSDDPELLNVPIGEGLRVIRQLITSTLQNEKLRELDRNMYILLGAYLDKVLPVLEASKTMFVRQLKLQVGMNVMDLTRWYSHEEVQMLVIRSCMEQILEKENDVTVVLVEAWKMLPQSRNTPVKLYFEKFIREGATNGNYLLIDAQDLGGVDKTPLRQVSVWIMGKMMETNEVERLIKQTLGLNVPAQEIQTLPLGHFTVASENKVTKVYVCPWSIPKDIAAAVAKGSLPPERVKTMLQEKRKMVERAEDVLSGNIQTRIAAIEKHVAATNKRLDLCVKNDAWLKNEIIDLKETCAFLEKKIEEIYACAAPTGVSTPIELQKTMYNISVAKKTIDIKLSDETIRGKIMWLAKEGFFASWRGLKDVVSELQRHKWTPPYNSVKAELSAMANDGRLAQKKSSSRAYLYALPPNVRFTE